MLYNAFKTILNSTKNHQSAWPFLEPVDRKLVPDYYEHIKYPMDLRTMTERLKSNYYCNKRLFIADIKRIISNCRAYNAPDTEYYNCAGMMEKYVMTKLKDHGFIDRWCARNFGNIFWRRNDVKIAAQILDLSYSLKKKCFRL